MVGSVRGAASLVDWELDRHGHAPYSVKVESCTILKKDENYDDATLGNRDDPHDLRGNRVPG